LFKTNQIKLIMKRLILSAAVLSLTVAACKKNADKFDARGTTAGTTSLPEVVLPLVIDQDRELANDTLYILDGKCYVTNGATMIIAPGTRIEAVKKSTNDSASALIITRGSKLFAQGGETEPIVFTSHEATPAAGDWGGIVMLGNAPLNRADATIEGINLPSVPAGVDINYGGGGAGLGDPHHYGGELVYVRIEYAGAAIATDNELNGLTLGGVGDATVLDYIQVAQGNDDAFEFFGGTVNAKHLVAHVADDDAFDFDFGYSGHIQFAVSVLDASQGYSANPNGIESDNDGQGSSNTPRTQALISNITVLGLNDSTDARTANLLSGANLRRNTSYRIKNSIFAGFPTAFLIQSAGSIAEAGNIDHSVVHAYSTVVNPSTVTLDASNIVFLSGASANSSILLTNPFAVAGPDFRPAPGSPAFNTTDYTGFPTGSGHNNFQVVSYRGAFDGSNDWTANWTRFNF
jgi:hypothetical protein